jgi:nicotinamidase-related amidase
MRYIGRQPRNSSQPGPMRTIDPAASALLIIDVQARLLPALEDGTSLAANARRLLDGAALLGVPVVYTEQKPRGLGGTVPELAPGPSAPVVAKMSFDASGVDGVGAGLAGKSDVVIAGCEAHVCVLQTALGLVDTGRRVFVVGDAVGSRRRESKKAALRRMERHGVEIVTAEMVLFEWLGTAEHPRFREIAAIIR